MTATYDTIEQRLEELFGSRDAGEQQEIRQRLAQARRLPRETPLTPDSRLPTDKRLYPTTINAERAEQGMQGLEVRLITDIFSELLPQAYWFAAQYFPTNEIDPQTTWADFLESSWKTPVVTAPSGSQEFIKYVCAAVIDKEGNYGQKGAVIGAADGTFLANHDTNTLYLSHIAVLESARKQGIASALENAMLSACNTLAMDAEKLLGTTYTLTPNGMKVQSMCGEIEFANLASEDGVHATVGRHIFHGKNGLSACGIRKRDGGVRYVQSDTTFGDKAYNAEEWTPVPLYFALRWIGNEQTQTVQGRTVKALLDLMYDGFIAADMTPEGVEADRNYAKKNVGARVTMYQFPTTPEQAVAFVQQQGETYGILSGVYREQNFAKDKADYKPTISPGDIPLILGGR
ncbi:GNAT family N-acetyltransferase [Candidatus Woesearchaeota archaeon]|nr:GNAT family N-acetyltransferase [Candidatus Woesearchaeota archaeon]